LVEDPNPAYNRLFFDGQAIDLNTLTPTWQKQFSFAVGGQAQYAGFNGANGTYWDDLYVNSTTKYGPWSGFTRGRSSTSGYTDVFPASDNSWHRLGYLSLQKGTISTFAVQDATNPHSDTTNYNPGSTLYGVHDTYWHTLDFANYPVTKAWKSPATGYCHFIHPSDAVTALENGPTSGTNSARPKSWGWFVYNGDVTTGVNNSANNNALFANWYHINPTHFCWEDTNLNIMYGHRIATPTNCYLTATRNYNFGNTVNYTSTSSLGVTKPFFMGVDNLNCPYWITVDPSNNGNPHNIYKYDGRTMALTTVLSGLAGSAFITNYRGYPSNIRRANSNTYVLYSGHWTTTGPRPFRITFDPTTGNVFTAACNIAYPGTTGYTNYASVIGNGGSLPYGADGSYCESFMLKPHQFTNNGNTYITYWLVDQTAYPTGTLSGALALAYTTNGQIRWGTSLQRTMLTYQINPTNGVSASANDSFFTYHSAYTFTSLADMPKNFMPINANNTLMAVVSYGKTSFLAWNNNTGWSSSGTYNQEFRMLGMDSTNRIWGYAMDKMNGSIHVITPSLSVNVAVTMAASNYTYSGTTINTSATINAYDYTGSRIAANVSLTIDGSTMTFASNGLKTLNVLTSASGDTTVNLNIYGGGVNNIYAYA
jgi:hypothetical protein